MTERGILLSAPMVPPVLADLKTQTRRIGPQPTSVVTTPGGHFLMFEEAVLDAFNRRERERLGRKHACTWKPGFGVSTRELKRLSPYGVPGDRLWVREAWRTVESLDAIRPVSLLESVPVRYEADKAIRGKFREPVGRYRHGRFMPRWASRTTLELVDVRFEQLHAITEEDARAEGVKFGELQPAIVNGEKSLAIFFNARDAFAYLWAGINGPASWKANPWVWVVGFKRIAQVGRSAA